MADVFISYSTEDRERARNVGRALEAYGWSVWWDRKIVAGQTFDRVIERELDAAKCVVVLWSQASVSSEWVRNEAAAAAERGTLVPAWIERVKVPLEFRRKHTVDLVEWRDDPSDSEFQALREGVSALITGTQSRLPPAQERRLRSRRWILGAAGTVAAAALTAAIVLVVASTRGDHSMSPAVPAPAPSISPDSPSIPKSRAEPPAPLGINREPIVPQPGPAPTGNADAAGTVPLDKKQEAESWFREGASLYVQQSYAEAAQRYRKAAEQGHGLAQYSLGTMYQRGLGVVRDDAAAATWYRKAADQGHVEAQYTLGDLSGWGGGRPENDAEAARWYRKAAEQGHAGARYKLAVLYYKGYGVAKDLPEAVKWHRMAAEQGLMAAQVELGVLYRNGTGVTMDADEARKWFRKAADQGNVVAEYYLGELSGWGSGRPENDREAAAWYRKAAEQGYADAQYSLAVLYYKGYGVPADETAAVDWFRKAAAQGHPSARRELERRGLGW